MSELYPILTWGAFETAEKIRREEITSLAVTQAHVDRLRETKTQLNAIVEERFEEALELARTVDREGPRDDQPLRGVPFTVKEMLAVEGFLSTAGSIHRRDSRRDFDSTVVARLRAAGAIVLATTNVPEMGFWFECENPVYGRTNNPYDLTRTCGGSSGGEGAVVGAGGSPFGVGSDIGGSVRLPAAFCGVFGHKPTNRLLPLTGHFPYEKAELLELRGDRYPLVSLGLIARRAKDLSPLLDLVRGPDEIDQEVRDLNLPPGSKDLTGLTVLVSEDPIIHMVRRTDEDVRTSVRNAARLLEAYGAKVRPLNPRFFVRAVELWTASVKDSKEKRFVENLSPDGTFSLAKEFLRTFTRAPHYSRPALLTVLGEQMFGRSKESWNALAPELAQLKADFARELGDGIYIGPVHSRVAPKHGATLWSPFDFVETGIFNSLGNPATAVPMGLNADGLPLAVQVVAPHFQDHRAISVAEVLEEGFGGWSPPRVEPAR